MTGNTYDFIECTGVIKTKILLIADQYQRCAVLAGYWLLLALLHSTSLLGHTVRFTHNVMLRGVGKIS